MAAQLNNILIVTIQSDTWKITSSLLHIVASAKHE